MARPRSFKREAEGLTVAISEPHPRWVSIHPSGDGLNQSITGLSIQEAEGLLYALSAALRDAKAEDA